MTCQVEEKNKRLKEEKAALLKENEDLRETVRLLLIELKK